MMRRRIIHKFSSIWMVKWSACLTLWHVAFTLWLFQEKPTGPSCTEGTETPVYNICLCCWEGARED